MTPIFEPLAKIIKRLTGVDCYRANLNGIAVSGPYATIYITPSSDATSRGSTFQQISEDGRDMEYTTKYPVVWDVMINFFRGNAIESASKLRRLHYLPQTSDELFLAGLSIVNSSPVQDLTELQSKNFEQRAVVTLTMVTLESITEKVGIIKSVDVVVENEQGKEIQKLEGDKIVAGH